MAGYAERLRAPFENDAAVRTAIADYFGESVVGYTGSQFERIGGPSDPDRFTALDFVAVSTLSVNVPPLAALHLLIDRVVREVERLLSDVPVDVDLWDDDAEPLVRKDGPMWQLYHLVRRASWPVVEQDIGHNDVGDTKASKLLAAKRPRLVPVYDSVVEAALGVEANRWLVGGTCGTPGPRSS